MLNLLSRIIELVSIQLFPIEMTAPEAPKPDLAPPLEIIVTMGE